MGWRLPTRGKSASSSLFYLFEKTSERGGIELGGRRIIRLKTSRMVSWRLPPRGKSASPSLFYPFEKTSEGGRNRIRRKENYSTQNRVDDGLAAFFSRKKRFTFSFLSIEEDFGRGRNCIGREMGRIRQCGAYGNAARCIGHRSTLHRPSHGAVFLETG